MAVNQKQIAERLGVSIALVSRVLSGKAAEIGIAQDTISRVLQAAEEMGYVPSASALGLKGKATRTIGVAVCDFNDPFFSSLIQEIQAQAHKHNYSLVLAGFLNRLPDRKDLQTFYKHAIDGLMILGSEDEASWLDDFVDFPVARIGYGSSDEKSVRISVDEVNAAENLLHYLTHKGAQRIVCLSGPLTAHRKRLDAFRNVADSAGISFKVIAEEDPDPFAAGMHTMNNLIQSGLEVDALVCVTDQIAMGAIHALANVGIDVPGRVAVTGFDDIPLAAQFIPPLTTFRQPSSEMVQEAFQSIVEKTGPREIVVEGGLVIRETA